MRSVAMAAAPRVTQASWPQTASQEKTMSQPAASATAASSVNSRSVAYGTTAPNLMPGHATEAARHVGVPSARSPARVAPLVRGVFLVGVPGARSAARVAPLTRCPQGRPGSSARGRRRGGWTGVHPTSSTADARRAVSARRPGRPGPRGSGPSTRPARRGGQSCRRAHGGRGRQVAREGSPDGGGQQRRAHRRRRHCGVRCGRRGPGRPWTGWRPCTPRGSPATTTRSSTSRSRGTTAATGWTACGGTVAPRCRPPRQPGCPGWRFPSLW